MALAEVVIANAPLAVDEVVRWPVFIVEGLPNLVVAVDGDGIVDLQVANRFLHVGALLLERELRGMHADHNQTGILVFRGPSFHVRQRAQAVDAGVRPEIDQHNFAAEGIAGQWR